MNSGTTVVFTTLALGFIAGILSGMFGIGGGLVIVPALVILFGLPMKTATGTSLFALLWPVGLLGVIEYWRNDKLDAWRGLWIAVGLFLGAYFGARITLAISPAGMKRAYAVFLLVVGAYFLLTVRNEPGPEVEVAPAPAPAPGPAQVH
jgi:uncharacterized membrane protein YfcA